MLATRQGARDDLDNINAVDAYLVLAVGVKMRPVMRDSGFGVHADNYSLSEERGRSSFLSEERGTQLVLETKLRPFPLLFFVVAQSDFAARLATRASASITAPYRM